jgi:hypothetical protein
MHQFIYGFLWTLGATTCLATVAAFTIFLFIRREKLDE